MQASLQQPHGIRKSCPCSDSSWQASRTHFTAAASISVLGRSPLYHVVAMTTLGRYKQAQFLLANGAVVTNIVWLCAGSEVLDQRTQIPVGETPETTIFRPAHRPPQNCPRASLAACKRCIQLCCCPPPRWQHPYSLNSRGAHIHNSAKSREDALPCAVRLQFPV